MINLNIHTSKNNFFNSNYFKVECHKLAIFLEDIQQGIVQIIPDLNVTINQFFETEVY